MHILLGLSKHAWDCMLLLRSRQACRQACNHHACMQSRRSHCWQRGKGPWQLHFCRYRLGYCCWYRTPQTSSSGRVAWQHRTQFPQCILSPCMCHLLLLTGRWSQASLCDWSNLVLPRFYRKRSGQLAALPSHKFARSSTVGAWCKWMLGGLQAISPSFTEALVPTHLLA